MSYTTWPMSFSRRVSVVRVGANTRTCARQMTTVMGIGTTSRTTTVMADMHSVTAGFKGGDAMIGLIIVVLGIWVFFGFHAVLVTALILACGVGALSLYEMTHEE